MAYEYEKSLKNRLLNLELDDYVEVIQLEKEYEELEEVYAKAKAWQTLKEEMITEYPYLVRVWESTNGEGEHAEMCKANEILERMDELDGTHEFSNLLNDMNREDK